MLKVIVLGAAAGGGVPQWNCNCEVCRTARLEDRAFRSGQASIAFSANGDDWFLINASPDLRQQVNATPELYPRHGLRHSPIAGVVLTNGEVDAVAGLLSLRESSPFSLFAHQRVLAVLDSNSLFNVLDRHLVPRIAIENGVTFTPKLADGSSSNLEITAFTVPGKPAWYLEIEGEPLETVEGDTVGLEIRSLADGSTFFFVAACGAVTPELADRLRGAALVFFDGTLWRDDEMILAGLGRKTGQRMGHISMSGPEGSIANLQDLGIERKVFIHINNSNRALLRDSDEHATLQDAGWQIAEDGMEFQL